MATDGNDVDVDDNNGTLDNSGDAINDKEHHAAADGVNVQTSFDKRCASPATSCMNFEGYRDRELDASVDAGSIHVEGGERCFTEDGKHFTNADISNALIKGSERYEADDDTDKYEVPEACHHPDTSSSHEMESDGCCSDNGVDDFPGNNIVETCL